MRVSHKVDYAVRILTLLGADASGVPVPRADIAERAGVPPGFLVDILRQLRAGELLRSQRGPEGGWRLARPAEDITVADIVRVVEGPLASVRGVRPHELPDQGVTEPFVSLWIATRAALRTVLERVTVADLAAGRLPADVMDLAATPDAWDPRG